MAKELAKKRTDREMSRGQLKAVLAYEIKETVCMVEHLLLFLETIGRSELKSKGAFTIPAVARLKVKTKPATPAGKRVVSGKVVKVKAIPSKKIVKAKSLIE